MTDLRCAMSDYLIVRRQLGFTLKEAGQDLERFIEFMDSAGAEHVTSELALSWATSVPAHPHRWRRALARDRLDR
jgi:integrase/recombinase XerD